MSHESENEIKCPYCDHQLDNFEYFDEVDDCPVDCPSCNKSFSLTVGVKYTFSTYKKACKDGTHTFGKYEQLDSCIHEDGTREVICENCDENNYINKDNKLLY